MIPSRHSFELLSRAEIRKIRFVPKAGKNLAVLEFKKNNVVGAEIRKIRFVPKAGKNLAALELKKDPPKLKDSETDNRKRTFLKLAGLVGAGVVASSLIPKKAEALVFGSTPASNVGGVKDSDNARISPATEETLQSTITGNTILKKTIALTSSGTVHTPASGKKLRIYNAKFSLSADMNSVGFRFTSGGTNYEYYYSPKTGGLYGSNNHPNYIEGGIDEAFYAVIDGTGTVQVNFDYLEV